MPNLLFSLANPARFRRIAKPLLIVCGLLGVVLFARGLWLALIDSPPDYQQLDAVRIMYVHVPAAWMALLTYTSLALAGLFFIVWKHTLAGLYIRAAAPVGAAFTALCLITGSLWGRPTWGTWWVWDARLTSVLVLFFLYLGVIAAADAFDDREKGQRVAAWMAVIGSINLPIIKFSVDWWNTLHQRASISSFARMASPALERSMLVPLLVMAAAYLCLFVFLVVVRTESEIIARRLETLKAGGNGG